MQKVLDNLLESCYDSHGMWKSYLKERENAEVIELEHGFAIIRPMADALYLQDIYVIPEQRQTGYGRKLLEVAEVRAKELGYSKILGSCSPGASGSTVSLKAILACGFELHSSDKDIIYLVKEI